LLDFDDTVGDNVNLIGLVYYQFKTNMRIEYHERDYSMWSVANQVIKDYNDDFSLATRTNSHILLQGDRLSDGSDPTNEQF
jgi:hypothetical protein